MGTAAMAENRFYPRKPSGLDPVISVRWDHFGFPTGILKLLVHLAPTEFAAAMQDHRASGGKFRKMLDHHQPGAWVGNGGGSGHQVMIQGDQTRRREMLGVFRQHGGSILPKLQAETVAKTLDRPMTHTDALFATLQYHDDELPGHDGV